MRLDLLDDGVAFALKYADLIEQAVERGAQLIVFPAYAWLPLMGLWPSLHQLAAARIAPPGADEGLDPGGGLALENIFRALVPAIRRIFETTAGELARRFGVYLMPGTSITLDRSARLFQTAYLYGPDGKLIGTQHVIHRSRREKDWNWFSVGTEVRVFELPFGKLAMPVSMDTAFWEIARVARLRGADILLGSAAQEDGDKFHMVARGVASRIQESPAYGAQVCCVTELFGLKFCGPSSIVAPLGVWDNESTIMGQTKTNDHEEVIAARLDLAFLRKWRSAQPRDYNIELYRKYLPRAYEMYRTKAIQDGRRKVT